MGRPYKVEQFLQAIPGSRGVVRIIAERVGCSWRTAMRHLAKHPTLRQAREDEINTIYDTAESLIHRNIELLYERQERKGKPVASWDAWKLLTQTRRGRERGYSERQEISGPDGAPQRIVVEYVNDSDSTPKATSGPDAH